MTQGPATYSAQRLYELLPAIYRLRDADNGDALRAILQVIGREIEIVEADITQLYDNWFIETCAEWVAPYIGDLLGVRGLRDLEAAGFTSRAFVANTLGYRRRKGTATMLEQLARDVTQWNARVVEFFELLGTTQYLNHVRLGNHRTPDLRDSNTLELLDTPFDRIAHTGDVRAIKARRAPSVRGRHNIPNIGIFIWRLSAYHVSRSAPWAVDAAQGRYTFSPLGNDAPIFNRPRTETTINTLAGEINVPGQVRRRALYDDLEAPRRARTEGTRVPATEYLGPDPVLEVFVPDSEDHLVEIPPTEILVCDLSDWREPPAQLEYKSPTRLNTSVDPPEPWREVFPIRVAVDPALGRLRFRADSAPARVAVSYTFGFSGDIGGGPYDRRYVSPRDARGRTPSPYENTVAEPDGLGVRLDVSETGIADIATALQQWQLDFAAGPAVIQIGDNRAYAGDLDFTMGTGDLVIQAARGQRPTVVGDIVVRGAGRARLMLNGLLIAGRVRVAEDESLRQLDILHCALVPGGRLNASGEPADLTAASVETNPPNLALQLNVERSITGPLRLPPDAPGLLVRDSIIESPGHTQAGFTPPAEDVAALEAAGLPVALVAPAIGGSNSGVEPGPRATLERVTVLGPTHVKELALGSETIFTGLVFAVRRQEGCLRFSYAPVASQTPRRFRCQPETAIGAAVEAAREQAGGGLAPGVETAIRQGILAWLQPSFTSTRFGAPGYGQLSRSCPVEIMTGAEDGSEMGAFSFLKQPQRLANLESNLEEYLRLGLQAGIFFAS